MTEESYLPQGRLDASDPSHRTKVRRPFEEAQTQTKILFDVFVRSRSLTHAKHVIHVRDKIGPLITTSTVVSDVNADGLSGASNARGDCAGNVRYVATHFGAAQRTRFASDETDAAEREIYSRPAENATAITAE